MTGIPLRLTAGPVILRDFRPEDVNDAAAIIGDDRVTRWLSFDSRDHAGAELMIRAAAASAADQPRTEYYLALTPADSESVIGFVRLALGAHESAKLGYAINADHWGRGYATHAARAMITFAFTTLHLHRITAAVGPDNHASQSVLKALGFAYEGRLRDHVFTNGAWRDSLLYSVLAQDRQNSSTPSGGPTHISSDQLAQASS